MPELRGIWAPAWDLSTPDAVRRVVDWSVSAGLNTLYAQVRYRGDALYASGIVPRHKPLDGTDPGFDPLGELLNASQDTGLSIHAWFPLMAIGSPNRPSPPGHLLQANPGWAAQTARSSADAVYLCPTAPGMPDALKRQVDELVTRYPVQGLHFDYSRMADPTMCRCTRCVRRFCTETRVSLPASVSDLWGKHRTAWNRWRCAQLNALLEKLVPSARALRSDLVVSSSVRTPWATEAVVRGQDWVHWLKRGWLDQTVPMAYGQQMSAIERDASDAVQQAPPHRVVLGLGAWRLSEAVVAAGIELSRRHRFAGFSLYSFDGLTRRGSDRSRLDALSAVLRDAPR